MHALLAHFYHLALHAYAFAMHPMWRAPVAALAAGLLLRLAGARAAPFAAALTVMAGWLAVQYPGFSVLPALPVDRLPGLALLLLAYGWLGSRTGRGARWLGPPLFSAVCAWWMAGAPSSGEAVAGCVPVFLGVWAALALGGRLAAKDTGWAGIAAALALGGAILLAGGSPHWARAAIVPACAGVALIGVEGAAPVLAMATMLLGCLAVLASDRGRFVPMDLAVLAPLVMWSLFFFEKKNQKTFGLKARTRRSASPK
jgi:hypothetical protein